MQDKRTHDCEVAYLPAVYKHILLSVEFWNPTEPKALKLSIFKCFGKATSITHWQIER